MAYMLSPAEVARRGAPVAQSMLVTATVALIFFVASFVWLMLGQENSGAPAGYYLGAAVLFAGLMMMLSLWLLSISAESMAVLRGSELQTAAVRESPDLVLQLDEELRVVSMNPAAERRFGHGTAAASGMPVSFLIPELKRGGMAAPLVEKRQARSMLSVEPQTSARRLAMRTGTRLSHLVQPLLGYTEIALEALEPGQAAVRGDLEQIGRASARVALLAQQLEIFGGVRRARVEPVELNALVESLERDVRFVLQPTTVLQLQEAGYPVTVEADPALTRTAILLLACNAEEAMAPGSTISIAVGPEEIRVADSGDGLPKEVRQAMFKPLVSTKDAERGVGLGLHAARAAMRLQHADLQLTESGESGSVLTLVFPRAGAEKTVPDQGHLAAVNAEPAPSSRQSQGNQSP